MQSVQRQAGERSWPLCDQSLHFDLGHVLSCAVTDVLEPGQIGALQVHHAGLWEYNLAERTLVWSGGVYDLFGLKRGSLITREEAVAHYTEDSRARLERLRSYAITHKCGFTLDAEIRAGGVGALRRMRVIGAAACDHDGVVTHLHGVKLVI